VSEERKETEAAEGRTHRRRERGVAEVEGRERQRDVPSEDDDGERNCEGACSGSARGSCRMQSNNGEDARGSMSRMASVMTMVVMRSLSAAGSRMLPRTEPMLNRRASHPSTCRQERGHVSSGSCGQSLEEGEGTHQVGHAGDEQERGRGREVALEDVVPDDGAGGHAGDGDRVRDRVGVLAGLVRLGRGGRERSRGVVGRGRRRCRLWRCRRSRE